MSETLKIHVRLMNEGTDVWRPVVARQLGDARFLILADQHYNKDDESWEFAPGTVVICEEQELSSERCLVAVAKGNRESNL